MPDLVLSLIQIDIKTPISNEILHSREFVYNKVLFSHERNHLQWSYHDLPFS